MNFARLTVALVLALAGFDATAQALEFKGVPLGATFEQVKTSGVLGDLDICNDFDGRQTSCMCPLGTFANEQVRGALAYFVDGRLSKVQVEFAPGRFASIARAVEEKYGKPAARSQSAVRNGLGASFQQVEMTWSIKDGAMIILRKYADTIDHGVIYLVSAQEVAAMRAMNRARPPAKKDI